MVPGSSAKWAAKWLREILTALREIGREMTPRNFAQPSAKFSQPSAKSVREIFRSDYQAQLFEFGTASAKFPGQIFEKNSKKYLKNRFHLYFTFHLHFKSSLDILFFKVFFCGPRAAPSDFAERF